MPAKTRNTEARDEYLDLVRKFPLKPIRTRAQLNAAHAVIDELTSIPEDRLSSDQADYLEVLGDLTLAYEQKHTDQTLADITGHRLLLHLMEEHEMNASSLGTLLGHRELGSKIVRRQRNISKSHAKSLGEHFGLPPEIFLR